MVFKKLKEYLKRNPDVKKIMNQLQIDEKSYLKCLRNMNSKRIVPKQIISNKTY